jgi:hypothetical protein
MPLSKRENNMLRLFFTLLILSVISTSASAGEVAFDSSKPGKLIITLAGEPLAEYVYQDSQIPRPYFASVHAPNGEQVTRPQPPDPKLDIADHPLFHPGIWLAFGILNESDYWRNAAKVEFVEFTEKPHTTSDGGEFAARFRYRDQKDPKQVVCDELFKCRILERPEGTLLLWDSTFSSDKEFTFGDQEEMGLGIRLATPLRSEQQPRGTIPAGTGTIRDAAGRKNGAEVWGNSSEWCDFSGTIDGKPVGVTLMCHPDNFRPSWFHARDYGLLVANPFGQKAFHKGEESNIKVKPGETLQLRYGILLHSDKEPDLAAAYQDYVKLSSQ